jgi:hypothetical protein
MEKRYRLNLLHKTLQAFSQCHQEESEKKGDYKIMHEVNTLKVGYHSFRSSLGRGNGLFRS